LYVNQPSPVTNVWGLAVAASRMTPTPSVYDRNETILVVGYSEGLLGRAKVNVLGRNHHRPHPDELCYARVDRVSPRLSDPVIDTLCDAHTKTPG
jgi:hypothetical protein